MNGKTRAALLGTLLGGCAAAPSLPVVSSDRLDRADIALSRGRVGETIDLLRGRVEGSVRGSKLLGRAHLALRENGLARTAFATALAVDPGDTEALLLLGEASERDRYFERALECYARALEHDASLGEAARRAGVLLLDLGRFEEASRALRRAADLLPDDIDVRFRLGVAELRRGDDEAAEAALDVVLRRGGPDPRALEARGIARARLASRKLAAASRPANAAELASAERDLVEAARLAPSDPGPPYNLGWVRELHGDAAGAESAYRDALARALHEPSSLRLAALLKGRGAHADALALLERIYPSVVDPRVRRPLADEIESLKKAVAEGRPPR